MYTLLGCGASRPAAAREGGNAHPPGHDDRAGRQAALEDLVPADELAAARTQEGVDAAHEPGLQLVLVAQPRRGQPRLARLARPPAHLGALRAAGPTQVAWRQRSP